MGFQYKFKEGDWRDYDGRSDATLQMAFMSGHKTCMLRIGDKQYDVNFERMTQKNKASGWERAIRPPLSMKNKRPEKPVIPEGRTVMVKVPAHVVAGTVLPVRHPHGGQFSVQVPPGAVPGSVMMVPVPDVHHAMPQQKPQPMQHMTPTMSTSAPSAPPSLPAPPIHTTNPSYTGQDVGNQSNKISAVVDTPPPPAKHGMSTGAKVATGTACVLGAGAVAGAVLIDQGVFSLDDVGDFFVDAGECIGDAFEDLGQGIVDLF